MYSGGIADKSGNQYEAKFLVYKLLDVLVGDLDWVRFEGITDGYEGFEFAVGKNAQTKWYQTKIRAPHGNWTIKSLKSQGVLDAFAKRLDVDPQSICSFVSQHPANDLEILSEKAKISNSAHEFEASLPEKQKFKLTDLSKAWEASKTIVFDRLQRSEFDVFPEREIDANIRVKAKFLFTEWEEDTYALLRAYMELNFNTKITTELIQEYLKEKEIGFKDWTLDPTLKQKIAKQTGRYLNTYIPFGAGGIKIDRKEATELIEDIHRENGSKVILLTGIAGSGKSGIIREVIEHLKIAELAHLAFRVDQHLDCKTPEEIGKELLGREESPAITLHGIAPNRSSVLIVDQVDAVSEVSGRKGAIKNAILEFLDGLQSLNTRIIFVCRDFDLENDSRLKALKGEKQTKRIKVGTLDWEEEICPVLEQKNIDTKRFTKSQKQLLSLPLNLSLYLEVGNQNLEFRSRDDLFHALIKKKEAEIMDRQLKWSLLEPLRSISNWMSNHQQLSTPLIILDDFPLAADILVSEGLIIIQERRINFFHESFFDYIYARAFFRSRQTIAELLLSTEQHLFRRTQVRQILEVLRQDDPSRYITELQSLFVKKIRYHIQIAIAKWLGSLKDPSAQERQIGLSLDDSLEGFSNLTKSILLGSAGWFDVHKSSWFLAILHGEDKKKRDSLLRWLLQIAHERPQGINRILRKWWNNNSEKALELLYYSNQINTRDAGDEIEPIETLYCDIISSEPSAYFENRANRSRDLVLNTWVNDNASRCSKFLKSYFNYWFKAHPGEQPFSYEPFFVLNEHAFSEASKKSPSQFIAGIIDAIIKSIELIDQKNSSGDWDSSFSSFDAKDCQGDDKVVELLRDSFKELAKDRPDLANQYLERIDPRRHNLFLHLHLETYAENPEFFKSSFLILLNCENLLGAGCVDVEWKSFANAVKSIIPFLTDAERRRVESKIRTHTPELDFASKHIHENQEPNRKYILQILANSGYEQWCILETIGTEYLSPEMRALSNQYKRKFTGRKVAEPRDRIRIGKVQSPIPQVHAQNMSDQQWLSAFSKYEKNNNKKRHDNFFVGGAQDLGAVLRECTKLKPNRFAHLLLQIPKEANPIYTSAILSGLRQTEDCSLENLKTVINFIVQYHESSFCREISELIGTYPKLCKEQKYLDLLLLYASSGTANDNVLGPKQEKSKEEIRTIEDVLGRIDRLYISGINGVRGAAVLALSRVYWEYPDYSDLIESFLSERIEEEPLTSVRCTFVTLLLPFYNYDREKCGLFYEQLVNHNPDTGKSLSILTSNKGIKLLQYIAVNVPESGKKLISLLVNADEKKSKLIGAWLVFGASYQEEKYEDLYEKLINRGIEYRRLAAQVAASFFSLAEFKDKAFKHLVAFFNDTDEHVRSNAAGVFKVIKSDEVEENHNLILSYLQSETFSADSFEFSRLLKEARSNVTEYVIQLAERILIERRSTDNSQHLRYKDYGYLQELLQGEYANSEGNQKLREKYLDIIDTMLELEIYGSERIVISHDRHY